MTDTGRGRRSVRILDGGLSTALEDVGFDVAHELWTAKAVIDAPDLVVAAHRAYIDAGAEVILTASYQAGIANVARHLGTQHEAHRVLTSSVALARRAVAECGARNIRVAASLGAYGALLADRSEFHGRYGVPWHEVAREQRRRLEVLIGTGVDLVVCETLPRVVEAELLLELLDDLVPPSGGVEVWMTFTVVGHGLTAGGDPLVDAVALAAGRPWLAGLGVNCSRPDHVDSALEALSSADRSLIAKPNQFDASDIERWIDLGVHYVGGCCGVGPRRLAALATYLS